VGVVMRGTGAARERTPGDEVERGKGKGDEEARQAAAARRSSTHKAWARTDSVSH